MSRVGVLGQGRTGVTRDGTACGVGNPSDWGVALELDAGAATVERGWRW